MGQEGIFGGSQKGGFQKGGFGGCSPGTKTGTRVRSPKPPFWKPPFYLPVTLFGVDKRVVSKRVVSADVPPERKPERGYVRQNHPFTKPPFYLPVNPNRGFSNVPWHKRAFRPGTKYVFYKQFLGILSGVAPANQTKERSVHELFAGAFQNKSLRCESCLFSQGKKNT